MRIAIAGFGVEGKASYDYWNHSGNELTIVDERDAVGNLPEGARTMLGEGMFGMLADFDLIIRSPSVNPAKLPYGEKVWSATNEFFKKCPAPIIGVTGTKGKGTTCSLLTSVLRAAGKKVHLVGNIGTPALAELPSINDNSIVVYELSSFQLWDFIGTPQVAVILMIEADHLDVHADMEEYVRAKANLTRHMSWDGTVYYQSANELSLRIANDFREDGTKAGIPFGMKQTGSVYEEDGFFKFGNETVAPRESLKLAGAHNVQNACAAIAASMNFIDDHTAVKEGLEAFDGLDHRLKNVGEVNGVTYFDDSIATTPGSAMAAIDSFEQQKIIILGGKSKGADYRELVEHCRDTNTMIVAMGENGEMISELAASMQVYCKRVIGDLDEVVRVASSIANEGDVVILSPAAASFDMFASYADRGDRFIEAVKLLNSQ